MTTANPVDTLLEATRAYLQARDEGRVAAFLAGCDWRMERRELAAHPLPCLAHLEQLGSDSLQKAVGKTETSLVQLLALHSNKFAWGQTYKRDDFGEAFLENYGWVELFGTRGHFVNNSLACGFLLLGPYLHYPDHHHIAEEIYIPLTAGTEWRAGGSAFLARQAGDVIHHASNVPHAMRTGVDPLLALYLWRGGPLDQRSTIDGQGKNG